MKKIIFLSLVVLLLNACTDDVSLSNSGAFSEAGTSQGQSGSITRFATHNGYMYALNPNAVLTYDLSNPENPELKHTLSTDYGLETIFIYDNTIFLGSRNALYILGIDNPENPEILSQSMRDDVFFGGCDPVVVKGNYAYSTIKIIENICGFTNTFSALIVYDVSNKENPIEVGTYFLNEPNGLGIKDNYLFICDAGADQVLVFDISDPTNLIEMYEYAIAADNPFDVIVNGNSMIVSQQTQFEIYDVSDIENISAIGTITR